MGHSAGHFWAGRREVAYFKIEAFVVSEPDASGSGSARRHTTEEPV